MCIGNSNTSPGLKLVRDIRLCRNGPSDDLHWLFTAFRTKAPLKGALKIRTCEGSSRALKWRMDCCYKSRMKWPPQFTSQNEELLFVGLSILAGLLRISSVPSSLLLRHLRKLAERMQNLEKQITHKQHSNPALDPETNAGAWEQHK